MFTLERPRTRQLVPSWRRLWHDSRSRPEANVSMNGARPPLPCEGSKGPCTDTSMSRMGRAAQPIPGTAPTQSALAELADAKPPALAGIVGPSERSQFGNRSALHLLAIPPPGGGELPGGVAILPTRDARPGAPGRLVSLAGVHRNGRLGNAQAGTYALASVTVALARTVNLLTPTRSARSDRFLHPCSCVRTPAGSCSACGSCEPSVSAGPVNDPNCRLVGPWCQNRPVAARRLGALPPAGARSSVLRRRRRR